MVLATEDQVVPPSVEISHLNTLPVCPVKVAVPLLVPEHTVALAPTAPPADTALAVIVATLEFAEEQAPLCTTALY